MMLARKAQNGFSLIELAIVLFVLSLLGVGAIQPLEMIYAHKKQVRAVAELQLIKESLLAYLVANGVLPCPQSVDKVTRQDYSLVSTATATCQIQSGVVPVRELGIAAQTNSTGVFVDPWGRPYRYIVSLNSHENLGIKSLPDWTSVGEVSRVGLKAVTADIKLCSIDMGSSCSAYNLIASNLVFIVLSLGPDASKTGLQKGNQDNDLNFVYPPGGAAGDQPFDDLLVWSSAADSLFWLLKAGWIP